MRAYVITTGVLFALLTLAHLARMYVEARFVADAVYWAITAATAAMAGWAAYVLRKSNP